jgi:UPF0755 protein
LLSRKQAILVGAFFLVLFSYLIYIFFSPNYYEGSGPRAFVLHHGDTFSQLTAKLRQEHIIRHALPFRIAGTLMGGTTRIVPGKYVIPNGLSYMALIEYFINGNCDREIAVHFPDGSSTDIIAQRLAALAICPADSFYHFYHSRESVKLFNVKADSLIGYLLPGDYTFYERSQPSDIIDSMKQKFFAFFDKNKVELARNLGLSRYDVLKLASIVEGETKRSAEMPIIAGVYLNRLRIGMKLQADPTLQFAKGGHWGRVDRQLLKINSPYNTYKYAGLPPGPIDNPGKAAINATLFPVRHDYLYFVADGSGGHSFSRSYSEHKKKAIAYIKRVYGNR